MKTVTALLFFGAFLALNEAAAFPDPEVQPDDPVPDVVPEAEGGNWAEKADLDPEEEETHPDADLMMSKISCPVGWSGFGNRCFRYFGLFRTWARAERHCLSLGAQLASVHSLLEHHQIQNLISESGGGDQETWIGASDAEENSFWFWSDGRVFQFTNWCSGQPDNLGAKQHCVLMNHSANKCWNDEQCAFSRPYVCVKKL
ncbi:ladderlectin-like [Poecilia latipinna]|uniref:ladderlectin-like n=1 Tax=Poecilia latipinna TaxID=48699 RepID=UPI00072D9BE3|nr:PREDICTED: ladderlectin-like [Poecilia latipinna]